MELRKYWEVLWKRKHLFLLTIGGIVILTLVWALSATHIYKATTKILIKMQDATTVINSTVPPTLGKLEFSTYSNAVNTVIEMINTNEALNKMIHDFGLMKKNGKPFSGIELLNSSLINLSINQIAVRIDQIANSDIIEIIGFSENPELAVRLSDELTKNTLNIFDKLNKDIIGHTIDVLTQQISRLEHLLFDIDETIKKYQIDQAAVNIDEKIENYTNQLVTTEMSIIRLSSEKKESHPDVKAALDQIAYIKNELKDIPIKQTEISSLKRIQSALHDVYITLVGDLEKAKLMQSLSISNIIVVDKAQIPEAIKKYYIHFPKKKLMLSLSIILGSFFGIIIVFFAEYLDDTIKNSNELHAWTGQKVLASIPWSNNVEWFPATDFSSISSAINDIWLSVIINAKKHHQSEPKVVSVTSYGEKEGKSLVTSHLGFLLSKMGYKTLLVDLNFSNPVLSELLMSYQMKDDTAGEQLIDDLQVFKTNVTNLYFLQAGFSKEAHMPLMENDISILNQIGVAKKKFDKIVIDLSSLRTSRYPLLIASESDVTILLVEAGKYQLENIQWAIRESHESGVMLAGLVLNKYKPGA